MGWVVVAGLGVAGLATGCVTGVPEPTVPDAAETAQDDAPLDHGADATEGLDDATKKRYEYLARLRLSVDQLKGVDAIRDRLLERIAPANEQRLAFQDAVVGAVEVCDSDYARLRIEGRRMIEAGNDAKPAVLDAINELHALLTPEQRRLAVDPLLEQSEERRERSDDDGFAKMGKQLDLGVGQVLRMAKRARTRMTLRRSERDALRDQFEEALKAFREPTFDAHRVAIVQEPLVEHAVQLVFDLAAIVLPELEQRQCTIIAEMARERLAREAK